MSLLAALVEECVAPRRTQVNTVCRIIIKAAQTGEIGDGKIFIHPVADVMCACHPTLAVSRSHCSCSCSCASAPCLSTCGHLHKSRPLQRRSLPIRVVLVHACGSTSKSQARRPRVGCRARGQACFDLISEMQAGHPPSRTALPAEALAPEMLSPEKLSPETLSLEECPFSRIKQKILPRLVRRLHKASAVLA